MVDDELRNTVDEDKATTIMGMEEVTETIIDMKIINQLISVSKTSNRYTQYLRF
jgi:L-lactate utilization protein LutB